MRFLLKNVPVPRFRRIINLEQRFSRKNSHWQSQWHTRISSLHRAAVTEQVIHKTTPEEAARIDRLAALAEQDRDDMIERQRLHEIAAREDSFKGDVLRAIAEADVRVTELAELAGVDLVTFDDFRCGLFELPLPAFERVARRMGFALTRALVVVGTL